MLPTNILAVALIGLASSVSAATNTSISAADTLAIKHSYINTLSPAQKLGTVCACALLRTFFSSKTFFSGTAVYTTEATHFWDLRADLSPGCIFVPATANDVAKGVVIFSMCQAQFAVRAGGHMPVCVVNFPSPFLDSIASVPVRVRCVSPISHSVEMRLHAYLCASVLTLTSADSRSSQH